MIGSSESMAMMKQLRRCCGGICFHEGESSSQVEMYGIFQSGSSLMLIPYGVLRSVGVRTIVVMESAGNGRRVMSSVISVSGG